MARIRKEYNLKGQIKTVSNIACEYIITSDNEFFNKIGEKETTEDLRNNFKLAGYHSKPHELFCEGDISILTSISEGFPYTVLESMSCGIPVVATDVGGVTEALDNSCGYICKPKDFEEIGNRVVELLNDKALREKMGENARKKVIENFTIGKFIAEYEDVYERVITREVKEVQMPILIPSMEEEQVKAS